MVRDERDILRGAGVSIKINGAPNTAARRGNRHLLRLLQQKTKKN